MPIHFQCECGRKYVLPDDRAGQAGRCKCKRQFVVPKPEEETGVGRNTSIIIAAIIGILALFAGMYWLSSDILSGGG